MSFEQNPVSKKQNSLARNSGAPGETRRQNSLGDNDLYWKILEQKKREQEQTQQETVIMVEKKTPWALIICLCMLCTALLCGG